MTSAATPAEPSALAALLARCGLGDRQALAELYKFTSAKLFGVALRILRREDWAEEVLQDSFLNIWSHAADYAAHKSQPMTWMTNIVRNRAFDWLRRPRHEETRGDYDVIAENVRDESAGPLEQLVSSREARALAHCLRQLDAQQRQTIVLAFNHGLSHSELASHLKQPLGTVKTWVRRGLAQLKGCLTSGAT